MDERSSWKVGLVTLLAVVGVLVMMAFLVPSVHEMVTGGRWHFYIVFDDAGGLQPAEKVLLSGVNVGTVSSVTLITDPDSKEARDVNASFQERGMPAHQPPYALVRVDIQKEYAGKLFLYYQYEEEASSLIGTSHQVTIIPGSPPAGVTPQDALVRADTVVMGTASGGIMGAMSKMTGTVGQLAGPTTGLIDQLTNLTRQVQGPATRLVNNLGTLSEKASGIVGDPRLKGDLMASMDQVHGATTNLRLMSDQLRSTVPGVSQNLLATTSNFRTASARVPGMVDQLQGTLNNTTRRADDAMRNIDAATASLNAPNGIIPHMNGAVQNIDTATAGLNGPNGLIPQMTGTMTNLNHLTSDPDLHTILANLRDSSAQLGPTLTQAQSTLKSFQSLGTTASGVLGQVGAVLPKHGAGAAAPSGPPPARQALGVTGGIGVYYSQVTDPSYPHSALVDPEFELSYGGNLYSLGIFDIGGANLLTAEVGRRLVGSGSAGLNYRFGLYRARAAIGTDVVLGRRIGVYGSLYNPNRPTIDLESTFDLTNNYGIWAGVDEINRHARPFVGFRIKP